MGEGGVEEDDNNPQQGGGRSAGVYIFIYSCGAGSVAIQLIDLGGHPLHGHIPGGFTGPCGAAADGAAPAAENNGKWEYTLAETVREEAGFQMTEH